MQLELIRTLQNLRTPALTYFFELITTIGGPQLLIGVLPLVFWCISTRSGFRLLLVVLLSAYVNSLLKDLGPFLIPADSGFYAVRPYLVHPDQVWTCRRDPLFDPNAALARLCYEEDSRAFPSGHAQVTIVAWAYFALLVRRRFFTLLAAFWVLLIGVSRIYLGQHWPSDVLGGWLIGILLLLGALGVFSRWHGQSHHLNWWLLGGLAVALPILLLVDPEPQSTRTQVLGLLAGVGLGYPLQQRYAPFAARVRWPLQIAKVLVGLLGVVVIQLGLNRALPEIYIVDLVLGILTGLWALFGAPLVFSRMTQPAMVD
jgi:membrane-associated phospholipid phosphatase